MFGSLLYMLTPIFTQTLEIDAAKYTLELEYCDNGLNTVGTHLPSWVTSWRPVNLPGEEPGWRQPNLGHLHMLWLVINPMSYDLQLPH